MKIGIKNIRNKKSFIISTMLLFCSSCIEYKPDIDLAGIYVNYYDTKDDILHYLILCRDSTYSHVYVAGSDTIFNSDKWHASFDKNAMCLRIVLDKWLPMGSETEFFSFGKTNIEDHVFIYRNYEKILSFYEDSKMYDFQKIECNEVLDCLEINYSDHK